MSIWDALGMTAGAAIADPIKEAGNAIDKVFTSDDERLSWMNKYDEIQKTLSLGQVEINKIDAISPNWFQNSWRPAIGWVCAICVFVYYFTQAIVLNGIWVYMCIKDNSVIPFPGDPHGLIELTSGVLGIYGTLRTLEKIKGVIN